MRLKFQNTVVILSGARGACGVEGPAFSFLGAPQGDCCHEEMKKSEEAA
jgi:hypothetical protein